MYEMIFIRGCIGCDVRLSMSGEPSNPESFVTGLAILLLVLHVRHTAVGIGTEHLATQETQHGRLAIVTVHHVISTPDCRGGWGRVEER